MSSPATIPAATTVKTESYRVAGGYKIVDRWFNVPLDYSSPTSETIVVFARSAIPNKSNDDGESGAKMPYAVYLQGGPGFECGPPNSHPLTNFLFEKGYQLLYLDQRGTGLSTIITPATLARDHRLSKNRTVQEQARYLKHFRADNIVRDCEAIRKVLLDNEKWTVVGQSFGGFCATAYLSLHPEGLKEVFTAGGMPPLVRNPDEVYRRTYKKVESRNAVYYEKYPQDIANVKSILRHLSASEVLLPSGGILTSRRFMGLGLGFGGHGGIDSIHFLVQHAVGDLELFKELTYKTLQSIEAHQSFDGNIIYAIGHETIYCQGEASRWSANRVLQDQSPLFVLDNIAQKPEAEPVYFTGEMVYPWMFDDYAELRKVKEVATILAHDADWTQLYDESKLAENTVPVYAATYVEDMYVDFEFARETAAKIKGAKEFITNAMFHNAIRNKTEGVMAELWKLKVGEVD
ncbi:hypothetical protein Q9L58_009514 [Maublancomyces gigas]|uniref:AB hydrolase-1 domain-containing protein n=1 Tax=Discina gigas TaxID=1032678 RepID=A0ABR3G6P2_9PEZI